MPKKIIIKRNAKAAIVMAVLSIFIFSLVQFLYRPKAHAQIFITSGTTWTVPSDWSSSDNTIEVIAAGGGGGGGFSDGSGSGGEGGGGGGAGAYSKATNVTLSPGSTVTVSIGAGGTGGATGATGVAASPGSNGGDTYLCNSTSNCSSISGSSVVIGAKGGLGGGGGASGVVGSSGTGGNSVNGVGSTKFSGGSGGAGGPTTSGAGGGGGGGGGAAGPNTAGNTAANPTGITGTAGGQGDGTAGGGGGSANGGAGGNGTEYDASHGAGGGGGGGNGFSRGSGTVGGDAGNYGGGGGGGGGNGSKQGSGGTGGAGHPGMIRITYNYTVQKDYRWRLDDGNETTGTSLAAQDTAASITYGTNVRLRISLANLGDTTTFSYRLDYAPYNNGCYSWSAVPTTATTQPFNVYDSSFVTDQAATTNVTSGPGVITDPAGYTFTGGKFIDNTSNTATNQTLGTQQFTELEFAIQPNANATNKTYCFRVTTSAGTPLDSYDNYPVLNINYPPSPPTIYSVLNSSTNVPRLPVFQLKSSDYNRDYLRYVVEVCTTNSWPCGAGGITYDQTSSQTCWTGQDDQSATAYQARSTVLNSTMAICSLQLANMLNPNTTYYMRAKAIDPGGSNTYSAYSSVVSFTTSTLDIQINGGTTITGGTKVGN